LEADNNLYFEDKDYLEDIDYFEDKDRMIKA